MCREGLAVLTRVRPLVAIVALAFMLALAFGPAALTAQVTSGFGAITVVDNSFHTEPGNAILRHNVPRLSVTVGSEVLTADFKGLFDSTGGLKRWGHPTSEVHIEETGTLTQYFQRGVIDFHDVGNGYVLERRLTWDYFGGGAGGSTDLGVEAGTTNNNSGEQLGPWGHKVSNFSVGGVNTGFLEFFNELGGTQAFGFPKTEARIDTNAAGTVHIAAATPGFVRQYFQAAVMEYHPQDPAAAVKLRLLGDDLRNQRRPGGAWQQIGAFTAASALTVGSVFSPEVVQPTTAGSVAVSTAVPVIVTATPTPAATATPVPTPQVLPSATAELIVVGTLDGGVALYDGTSWTHFNATNSVLSTNLVRTVLVDKDGLIWAGTDTGAVRISRAGIGAAFSKVATTGGIGSDDVRALTGRQSADYVWFGHPDQGASRFDGVNWARYRKDNSNIPSNTIRDLHMVSESQGRLWFATAGGAALYDQTADTWTTYTTANSGILDNDVTAVTIDATGAFWFGTGTAGVSHTQNLVAWTSYTTANGLGSNDVRDILVGSDGAVWFATEGGVSRYINGVFSTSNVANSGVPSNSTRALAEDAQGNIWVATDGGVGRFDGTTWVSFTTTSGLASNVTTSLAIAPAIVGS